LPVLYIADPSHCPAWSKKTGILPKHKASLAKIHIRFYPCLNERVNMENDKKQSMKAIGTGDGLWTMNAGGIKDDGNPLNASLTI